MKFMYFSIKYCYSDILLKKTYKTSFITIFLLLSHLFLYCIDMVFVTSASCYLMSASCYHPHYRSKSSMYIRGLIPWNFAEWAEAVPIGIRATWRFRIAKIFPFQYPRWPPWQHFWKFFLLAWSWAKLFNWHPDVIPERNFCLVNFEKISTDDIVWWNCRLHATMDNVVHTVCYIDVCFVCLFVWFDSLPPINNLSVKQGQVFMGWTSTKLG